MTTHVNTKAYRATILVRHNHRSIAAFKKRNKKSYFFLARSPLDGVFFSNIYIYTLIMKLCKYILKLIDKYSPGPAI